MARKMREVRKTLLAVGEGATEVAFLTYLREMYCSDRQGVSVKVRNAQGKGPEHVVSHAIGQCRDADYDRRLALLDTDLPWTTELLKRATDYRIELMGSDPCIEGLFLAILGKTVPANSSESKKRLQRLIGSDMTEKSHYSDHFPRPVIEAARKRLPSLNRLLECFEGK